MSLLTLPPDLLREIRHGDFGQPPRRRGPDGREHVRWRERVRRACARALWAAVLDHGVPVASR